LGSYFLAIGLFMGLFCLIYSLFRGKLAPGNPWGGATLEWQCSSPPPHDNFSSPPVVGDPYVMKNIKYDPKAGSYIKVEDA
jgi:cytochrome c oxidase subunit 1